MDYQIFINIIIGVLMTLGVHVLNRITKSIDDQAARHDDLSARLADRVQAIEVLVAGSYIRRDEFERLSSAIFAKLDKIEGKLDRKTDAEICNGRHSGHSG